MLDLNGLFDFSSIRALKSGLFTGGLMESCCNSLSFALILSLCLLKLSLIVCLLDAAALQIWFTFSLPVPHFLLVIGHQQPWIAFLFVNTIFFTSETTFIVNHSSHNVLLAFTELSYSCVGFSTTSKS